MLEALDRFENVVEVRSVLNFIDLNYITKEDLENVLDLAEDYNIDLGNYDLENMWLIEVHQHCMEAIEAEYTILRDLFVQLDGKLL